MLSEHNKIVFHIKPPESNWISSKKSQCVISADYEDLTQEEYTTYLQEAYGLDAVLAHKV